MMSAATATPTTIAPAPFTIAAATEYPHAYPHKRNAARSYMECNKADRPVLPDALFHEYIRLYFTQGQCHALAMVLDELTDCTLMGSDWSEDGVPNHVFVKLPNGMGLDICGINAQGQHPDERFHDDWKEMTLEDVHYLPYRLPRMDIALPYAQMLVNWYDL